MRNTNKSHFQQLPSTGGDVSTFFAHPCIYILQISLSLSKSKPLGKYITQLKTLSK